MSDIVERLHTIAVDAYMTPEQWAVVEEAKAEIERLRAIVDRLPVTADGVRVAPGDEVFHPKARFATAPLLVESSIYAPAYWFVRVPRPGPRPQYVTITNESVSECYSTCEAAEAAARDSA